MSLVEEQMNERRARILAAARRLISEGGFEGLTMRQLAEVARVSVPTVYNLIGNKYLLLEALVKEQLSEAVASASRLPADLSVIETIERLPSVAHDVLLANPGYSRALIHVFLTSDDSAPAHRMLDAQSMALMALAIRRGQRTGEICPWADPDTVARAMYGLYVYALLGWAGGEIEDDELRERTCHDMALVLLGLSIGEARTRLEHKLQAQHEARRQANTAKEGG